MLTWQNFYDSLRVQIPEVKYRYGNILISLVDPLNLRAFLIEKGFGFVCLFDINKINIKTDPVLGECYMICGVNYISENSDSKKFSLLEVLLYIASTVYFKNTKAPFFEPFRMVTSDGYDISLVKTKKEGEIITNIVIGYQNGFVSDCMTSFARYRITTK